MVLVNAAIYLLRNVLKSLVCDELLVFSVRMKKYQEVAQIYRTYKYYKDVLVFDFIIKTYTFDEVAAV